MSSNDHARRDYFVGTTVAAARAEGREVDAEAVGRAAARDLAILDRARANGDIKDETRPKTEKPAPRQQTRNHAGEFAARMGATTWEAPLTFEKERPLPKLYGVDAMRLIAMDARVRLLTAPVPGYRLKVTKDANGQITDCEPLGNQCQYPAFANLLFMHTACFSRRLGSYRDMKYADRVRKYQNEIEKICNRSDAAVGFGWWVKK